MALEDVIEKYIQFKIVMMMLESIGEGGYTEEDIQEILNRIDENIDDVIEWLEAKFGGASLRIREMYAVKIVNHPVIEDLIKYARIYGSVYFSNVEDLVLAKHIYPASIVFSIEEVEEGGS